MVATYVPGPHGPMVFASTAGGGGFTPGTLTGLIGWWKADAGVFNDAGTTPASNGNTVNQWNDQSGTGNHLSPPSGATGPTFNTGVLNGLPGLAYVSGSTNMLTKSSFSLGGTTASVFIVAKIASGAAASGRFIDFQKSTDNNDFGVSTSAIFLYAPTTASVSGFRSGGGLSNGSVTNNTFTQLGSIYDGTNNTVYIGGTGQTPVANTDTFGASGFFNVGGFLNNTTTPSALLDGSIVEIVVTNTALGGTDRASLKTYFTSRWGV